MHDGLKCGPSRAQHTAEAWPEEGDRDGRGLEIVSREIVGKLSFCVPGAFNPLNNPVRGEILLSSLYRGGN